MKQKINYIQVVTAIILDQKNRLLVSQRSLNSQVAPGKWQNPGGKVESGEGHSEALKREVKEETDMDIKSIGKLLFKFKDFENGFEIYFYKVEAGGQPKVKEPDKLNSAWIYLEASELRKKDTAPALAEFLKTVNKI
jgi:mutator protein MutT